MMHRAARPSAVLAGGMAAVLALALVGARPAPLAAQGGRPSAAPPQTRVAVPDFAGLQIQPYEPPKPAPSFALPDLDGRTVRLEDFRGKALLLVFLPTW